MEAATLLDVRNLMEANRRIAELEAALAASEADTRRLDWIEANAGFIELGDDGAKDQPYWLNVWGKTEDAAMSILAPTLREAIDAAALPPPAAGPSPATGKEGPRDA